MADWISLLQRCFFGGTGLAAIFTGAFLFCGLLYKIKKAFQKSPAGQPYSRREHPLSGVTGRARVAYLILCLENVLCHYDLAGWSGVLDRLWRLTETTENVGFPQLFRVCAILPVNILPYGRMEDLVMDLLQEDLNDFFDGKPGVTADEFRYLRGLYENAGWRLCVLDPLLQAIYKVAAASWADGRKEFEGVVMDLLEQSERLLDGWGIPLPEIPPALLHKTGRGWGAPFDSAEFRRKELRKIEKA